MLKVNLPSREHDAAAERDIKKAELEVRRLEAAKALSAASLPWWRRADPIFLAILAGIVTLLGNMSVALWNSHSSVTQQKEKSSDDLALEQAKARYNLVLQAMATSDASVAKRNINFFIDAGLLDDSDCKIRVAIDRDQPVLPSLTGTLPAIPPGLHSATEIAKLYDFPIGLDGRGVSMGFLEFNGAVHAEDLAAYFKSLNLPVPDIKIISIDGFVPDSSEADDTQVLLDTEVAGSIAPRAQIRIYFAPYTALGIAHAAKQASDDHVSVLSTGWGQPEDAWSSEDVEAISSAFMLATQSGVTVVATASDHGVTDGMKDGKRHVDFPASSPWVLAVGGTTLTSSNGTIKSETAWKGATGEFATGGGVSKRFARPEWQNDVNVPKREDGGSGRGIPDIVATASPENGVVIKVNGQSAIIGGSSAAVPLIDGLIALIDQALGYRVGYLNPTLYKEIGPAGIFRTVKSGDNGVNGVTGYTAGLGWSAVGGWGSPDGAKLLAWFRDHPSPNANTDPFVAPCRPASKF